MDWSVANEKFGEITVHENFWTGGMTLKIGDLPVKKVKRREFSFEWEGEEQKVKILGNDVIGIKLGFPDGGTVEVLPGFRWYESIFVGLIFFFHLIWGNIPPLVQIFPLVGGAIGGLIGGAFTALAIYVMRVVKNVFARIGICLGFLAVSIVISFLVAVIIIGIGMLG